MKPIKTRGLPLFAAAALAALAPHARAADPGPIELGVSTGYTRGVGRAAGMMMPTLQDLAGHGGAVKVDVGWRLDPTFLVGVYVEADRLGRAERGTEGMTGAAAGVQAQLHLDAGSTLDPWIGVGTGWRGLWLEHAAGTHALQGLDLARVQLGLDYRVSRRLHLAPTVGITLTELLSEKRPGAAGYSDLEERRTGSFLFAGVSGRFDVLGGDPERR